MISLIRVPVGPGSAADRQQLLLEFQGLIRPVNIRGYEFLGRTARGTLNDLREAEKRLKQLTARSSEERARDIRRIQDFLRKKQTALRQQRESTINCSATVLDDESGEEVVCTNFVAKPRADRLIQDGLPVTCYKCGERQAKEGKIRLFDGVDWQCK